MHQKIDMKIPFFLTTRKSYLLLKHRPGRLPSPVYHHPGTPYGGELGALINHLGKTTMYKSMCTNSEVDVSRTIQSILGPHLG